MTLIQIPSEEKEVYEQTCAMIDIKVNFYTQENNPGLLTVEVYTDSCKIMHGLTKIACEFLAAKRSLNRIIK